MLDLSTNKIALSSNLIILQIRKEYESKNMNLMASLSPDAQKKAKPFAVQLYDVRKVRKSLKKHFHTTCKNIVRKTKTCLSLFTSIQIRENEDHLELNDVDAATPLKQWCENLGVDATEEVDRIHKV